MIVSTLTATVTTHQAGGPAMASRTLARRGFFFSETEAFDYHRLRARAELPGQGRAGTEEIWYVLAGTGQLTAAGQPPAPIRAGQLVVCTAPEASTLAAGEAGLELLLVAVHPERACAAMPARLPVAS